MPEVPVLAPIAGEAVERLVSPGQVIQAGATQVFTISNMGSVWVLVSVYERDMGAVHLGDPVTIQTDAYPEEFHGRISYIGAALDPNSHTLPVRIVTQNPGEKLKKDMYVTATIQAGRHSQRSDGAGFSRVAECRKRALCLRRGQPESVRRAPGYDRRDRRW